MAETTGASTNEETGGARDAEFGASLVGEMRVLTMQASSLAANAFLAEDLVQDTIERALRRRDTFSPGTSLRSWLLRIMRNLFIDWCREKTRHHDVEPCDEG